jgi:hypothetical protein
VELNDLRRLFLDGEEGAEGEQMIGPEAEVAVHDAVERANEQPRADQEDEAECRLADDQCGVQAMLAASGRIAAEAALQQRGGIGLCGAPRGQRAEEKRGDGGEREGKEQDEAAYGSLIHTRDIRQGSERDTEGQSREACAKCAPDGGE